MDLNISNTKIKLTCHIFYFVFGAGFILNQVFDMQWLIYVKVLPLIIMMILLLPFRKIQNGWLVIFGVFFGLIGDLVLQHGGQSLFAVGTGAFLLNHFFYNFYFLSLWEYRLGSLLFRRRYIALFISAIFISISSINIVTAISDQTKNKEMILIILLPIYTVFLNFTAILPCLLFLGQEKISCQTICLIIGGICFYISDNVLGRSKFSDFSLGARWIRALVIMGTYYLAQYLIPVGAMNAKHHKFKHQEEQSLIGSQIQ